MSPNRPSTRREFLQGQAAVDHLVDRLDGAGGVDSGEKAPAAHDATAYLVHFGRRAMACQFEIYLNAGQYPHATEAAIEALDLVDRLEDQMSVYREHSELSRINRTADRGPVAVEPGLFDCLATALEIYQDTGGAFDITSGPLSRAWGFMRRAGRMPSDDELSTALEKVGSRHVKLDAAALTVELLEPGVELNLNGIGKGYALDRARAMLVESGVRDFLFHGGQSSVLAVGSNGSRPGGGWSVGLRHPLRPERRIAEFYLRDRALGTSGSGTQFFHYRGQRYGHVLDPRSGRPAAGVYSSTVLAPTAAQADALATAFYVLGPDAAAEFCRRHDQIAAAVVFPGDRDGTVQVVSCGLGEDDWDLFEGG